MCCSICDRLAGRLRPIAWALSLSMMGGAAAHGNQQPPPPTPAAAPAAQDAAGAVALSEARRLFESGEYERAVNLLDQAVFLLDAQSRTNPTAKDALLTAYELRARAQFSLNKVADARSNFEALLRRSPTHSLSEQVSPRVLNLFEDVRKAVTGAVLFEVSVNDAEIKIDGDQLMAWVDPVTLAEGVHTVTATRPGYSPLTASFTVAPGPAVQSVPVKLDRISALLAIVTVPAGVEVSLNGVVRGTTEPGAASSPAGTPAGPPGSSKPMVLSDLPVGAHTLEFRRECYVPTQKRITISQLADFREDPIELKPAVATVNVAVKGAGSTVHLDDAPRGSAPMVLDGVCEGTHTVEVRSSYGRFVRRLVVKTGDSVSLEGTVKPAFAIVSVAGQGEVIRGGTDPRLVVERAFSDDGTVALFAPAADKTEQASRLQQLSPGWLAFDRSGRAVGRSAATIAPAARIDISTQLARSLDVQGVAGLALTSPDGDEMLISLLAAGSAEPDVIQLKLTDGDSMAAARRALSTAISLFRHSIGVLAIDFLDMPGATIAHVEQTGTAAMAGLVPGDLITGANGQKVRSVNDFEKVLESLAADRKLVLDVHGPAGGMRSVDLNAVLVPRALVMSDQTLLANKAILDLRHRLPTAINTPEEPVVRLNLAIALMHAKSWAAARSELERVTLPSAPGISNGTVQYLLGLCYEALGLANDAARAWKTAAADTTGLLTEDGPPIAEMAASKLAAFERSRR